FSAVYGRPMPRRPLRRPRSDADPFATPASVRDRLAAADPPERLPRPRRSLPDGRAVLGGLLVACAMLGTWWVSTSAHQGAPTRYLVAARAIAPGHRFEPADVRLVAMDLAPPVRAGALTDPAALEGSVALGPLTEGALVQEAALAPA